MNADLFRKHLANFGDPQHPEVYADDIVMDFPYAPKHHTGRREGKEAVLGFLRNVGVYFRDIKIGEPKFHETTDPNVIIVEFPGQSVSTETGLEYKQNYITVATFRNGQIAHMKEYYNPIPVLVSTGEMEEPGG